MSFTCQDWTVTKSKKHNIGPFYSLLKQRIILNVGSIRLFYSSKKLCYAPYLHTFRWKNEFQPPVDPKLLGYFFHPRSIAFVGASSQIGPYAFHRHPHLRSRSIKKSWTNALSSAGCAGPEKRSGPGLENYLSICNPSVLTKKPSRIWRAFVCGELGCFDQRSLGTMRGGPF